MGARSDCRTISPSLSQVIPSHCRPDMISASDSLVLRALSVSLLRKTILPRFFLAKRWLKSAVRAVPMCSFPVGLGGILVIIMKVRIYVALQYRVKYLRFSQRHQRLQRLWRPDSLSATSLDCQ